MTVAEILAAHNNTNTNVLTKLEGDAGKRAEGQFVLDGQPLGTSDGFRNVSKIWLDKTMTYEKGLAQLEAGRAATEDITATVREMVPAVSPKGQFAFHHKPTDRYFVPTEHALTHVGNWAETGTWTPINLTKPITNYKGDAIAERDRGDAETLAHLLNNGFRRIDQDKKFFWRTRQDGTLRAMLTDRYAQIDNRWFIELLAKLIPGGRLSHWRGDSDTLYGNILIPDTIREDSDSDYGGMLSVGNSEIGERRVSSMPSIFRAICMNGNIWGQTKGKGIKQVHRGAVKLDSLAHEIKENLNIQIPLLPVGIDRFLKTKTFAWDGAATSAKVVIAQLAKDTKLSKKEATDVLKAWGIEDKQTPGLGYSLFGLINGVTRAGQEQTNQRWVDFDVLGGELTAYTEDDFKRLIKRSNTLEKKEVEDMFLVAV